MFPYPHSIPRLARKPLLLAILLTGSCGLSPAEVTSAKAISPEGERVATDYLLESGFISAFSPQSGSEDSCGGFLAAPMLWASAAHCATSFRERGQFIAMTFLGDSAASQGSTGENTNALQDFSPSEVRNAWIPPAFLNAERDAEAIARQIVGEVYEAFSALHSRCDAALDRDCDGGDFFLWLSRNLAELDAQDRAFADAKIAAYNAAIKQPGPYDFALFPQRISCRAPAIYAKQRVWLRNAGQAPDRSSWWSAGRDGVQPKRTLVDFDGESARRSSTPAAPSAAGWSSTSLEARPDRFLCEGDSGMPLVDCSQSQRLSELGEVEAERAQSACPIRGLLSTTIDLDPSMVDEPITENARQALERSCGKHVILSDLEGAAYRALIEHVEAHCDHFLRNPERFARPEAMKCATGCASEEGAAYDAEAWCRSFIERKGRGEL